MKVTKQGLQVPVWMLKLAISLHSLFPDWAFNEESLPHKEKIKNPAKSVRKKIIFFMKKKLTCEESNTWIFRILGFSGLIYLIFKDLQARVVQNHFASPIHTTG